MKKKIFLLVISWVVALIIAFLLVNTFLLFYQRPTGFIERNNGATSVHNPFKTLIKNTEGHGIYKADANGYFNQGNLVESGYTIVFGASHTAGKEVKMGKRYSDVLNDLLKKHTKNEDYDSLLVYNVSQDEYYFPAIVNGFSALVAEFPNSNNIILEIGNTKYTEDELKYAFPQIEYSETSNTKYIVDNLSFKEQLYINIKEWFPLLSSLKNKISSIASLGKKDSVIKNFDMDNYKNTISLYLETIKSQYKGNLAVLYHPKVIIENNTMKIKEEETTTTFSQLCEENNIGFIDMSDYFLQAYKKNYTVPYGFNNTTFANGHLNEAGHRLVAEAIYKYIVYKEEEGE